MFRTYIKTNKNLISTSLKSIQFKFLDPKQNKIVISKNLLVNFLFTKRKNYPIFINYLGLNVLVAKKIKKN
jgi:hypothetical protein